MKKIGLIIPSFYPATIYGGPIFSTLSTANELVKLENLEVYVSSTNANMTKRLAIKTNTWIFFRKNFYVKYYNETKVGFFSLSFIFNVWRDIKVSDVIHIQSIFNIQTPVSLFYAYLFRKPVLLSPRGQFGDWCLINGSPFKNRWLKWLIKPFAYKVVWHATAEQEKNEILAIFPVAKVKVISNGVNYDVLQSLNILSPKEFVLKFAKKKIDIDKIVVSMGRLQKKKGFDILIDSFLMVLKKYPAAKLFIAGQDEGEKNTLKKQIINLGLENKTFLVGSLSKQTKFVFLANADVFVLPSHNENFGNVYIESLVAGTPIVASRNTPWSEVEEANCGKWVNNTVNETADAMLEMLQRDREIMRKNSRKYAEKYDWKNIAIQFKELFEEMVDE